MVQSKDLFLSEYLDDLLVVPELGQVQSIVPLSVPEAEVHTLILEEPDNVHISLIRSLHHGRELKSAAWCVEVSSSCSQGLQSVQVLFLNY